MRTSSKAAMSTLSKSPVCRTDIAWRPVQAKNGKLRHSEVARCGDCGNNLQTLNAKHSNDVKRSTYSEYGPLTSRAGRGAARSRSPRRASVPVCDEPHGPLTTASDELPPTASTSGTTNNVSFPDSLSDAIEAYDAPSRSGRHGFESAILGYSPPVDPPMSSGEFATDALRKVSAWRDTAFIKQHMRPHPDDSTRTWTPPPTYEIDFAKPTCDVEARTVTFPVYRRYIIGMISTAGSISIIYEPYLPRDGACSWSRR